MSSPQKADVAPQATPALKRGDWRMTVSVLASGQARAFADDVYTARVLFEEVGVGYTGYLEYTPAPWPEQITRPILKAVARWYDKGEPGDDWAAPHLEYIRNVGPGTWDFSVRSVYID